jgi:hypothetical protein
MAVDSVDEAIALANQSSFGLNAKYMGIHACGYGHCPAIA